MIIVYIMLALFIIISTGLLVLYLYLEIKYPYKDPLFERVEQIRLNLLKIQLQDCIEKEDYLNAQKCKQLIDDYEKTTTINTTNDNTILQQGRR